MIRILCLMNIMLIATPIFAQREHPFLIVKKEMYPELRERASQWPWDKMKAEAIAYKSTYDASKGYGSKASLLNKIVNRGALAYILDPDQKAMYAGRIVSAITTGWPDLRPGLGTNNHETVVPPGTAFFNSVLALDIVHDDVSATDLSRAEAALQSIAEWYINNTTSWKLNLYGTRCIWGLYTGNRTLIDKAKADYRAELHSQLTPDGVFMAGSGYAGARLGIARDAKTHLMDVLEFTGEERYYDDPVLVNFYEWLFGYSVTPFRMRYSFGDSGPNRNALSTGARSGSAYRFSERAAKYAAWNANGKAPNTSLLAYVLMGEPLPDPELPVSRIFRDGGAWFREPITSVDALGGMMINATTYDGHSHLDVNAVHLAAYGEHVLRNSGYTGWGDGELGFSWDYIHSTAKSSNTMTLNDGFHTVRYGAGIDEGFTSSGFDYASGNSGGAIFGGRQLRNFCLVHASSNTNGYFLIFDEVFAGSLAHTVDLFWHPNSDEAMVVSADEAFSWRIGSFHVADFDTDISNNGLDVRFGENDVAVTIYLATPPDKTSVERGLLAGMSDASNCFVGECLHATYPVGQSRRPHVVTVVYPHDKTHAKANLSRIAGEGYTGAVVRHNTGVVDVALESTGADTATYGGISVHGLAAWFRKESDGISSFFVRKGTFYSDGGIIPYGFASDSNISIHLSGPQGHLVSPDCSVTFFYDGQFDVILDENQTLLPISTGVGWVKVAVPKGTHRVELKQTGVIAPADPRADFDGSGRVDFGDFIVFAGAFGLPDPAFDLDVSGTVDFVDFLIFSRAFGKPVSE